MSGNEAKSIEMMYQRLTQLEHLLHRPDTFVGSIEPTTTTMYVAAAAPTAPETGQAGPADAAAEGGTGGGPTLVQREITYTPALYKICDEIFVNALDHHARLKAAG